MPGLDYQPAPPQEQEDELLIRQRARHGLTLFMVYLVLYGGFMALNAFRPEWMEVTVAGVNLAVLYGFGLIVTAFILALVYAWLCRSALPASSDSDRRKDAS
jgi:uncharacterized membrane protein (DUF485 family)